MPVVAGAARHDMVTMLELRSRDAAFYEQTPGTWTFSDLPDSVLAFHGPWRALCRDSAETTTLFIEAVRRDS